jgi:hypothetical protein
MTISRPRFTETFSPPGPYAQTHRLSRTGRRPNESSNPEPGVLHQASFEPSQLHGAGPPGQKEVYSPNSACGSSRLRTLKCLLESPRSSGRT